jgi:hypothetical protein
VPIVLHPFINLKKLPLWILGSFLFSCQSSDTPHQITPAFYHWKTNFEPTDFEKSYLSANHKIYVKFFDVDIENGKPIPKATVNFRQILSQQIIPTIFITNRTLVQSSESQIEALSKHISVKIKGLCSQNKIQFDELQFDCDWTQSTRNKYFELLKLLKNEFPETTLSATIRLHQVKFTETTGVPPVARGMLMCYNMDDWKKVNTRNSIFDAEVLEKYADKIADYPLDLDLAMPLFRWTIIYRNGRFVAFINNLDEEKLKTFSYVNPVKKHIFEVKNDTNALGISLHYGDILRSEGIEYETLQKGTRYVLNRIKNPRLTLSFYHLDSLTLKPFSNEQLKNLYSQTP